MRKILTIALLSICSILVGCGAKEKAVEIEAKTLAAGDVFSVKDNKQGDYNFTVLGAKNLGAHPGDDLKQDRLQIEWEIDNINFNGQAIINEETINNVVALEATDIIVKDANGYVLDVMTSGWEGDWINDSKPVAAGSKMKKKYTWLLHNPTEYVIVSFSRMNDTKQEFKINIQK